MTKEYKMLWFAVDIPQGQRYFFICGCKRAVTLSSSRRPPLAARHRFREKSRFPQLAAFLPRPT